MRYTFKNRDIKNREAAEARIILEKAEFKAKGSPPSKVKKAPSSIVEERMKFEMNSKEKGELDKSEKKPNATLLGTRTSDITANVRVARKNEDERTRNLVDGGEFESLPTSRSFLCMLYISLLFLYNIFLHLYINIAHSLLTILLNLFIYF